MLDKIAAKGIRFDQAITCGGWTRPSLTGLFSSAFPSMYGSIWGGYQYIRPSLPEILQNKGIMTSAFVSNPQAGTLYGFERGFDIFEEPEPTYAGPKWAYVRGMQRVLQIHQIHSLLKFFNIETAPPAVTATAEELTGQLANWLKGQSSPFFVWAHYMDTHWPYHISQDLHNANRIAQAWADLRAMHVCSLHHGRYHPGAQRMSSVVSAYHNAIEYIDNCIGRLFKRLEDYSLLDNTAVIITADHGEEFFEHGRWGHYQLFDENIKVPLLMWLPGLNKAISVERQVSHLDLATTILAIFKLPVGEGMLGRDLLSMLDKTEVGESRAVYVESMWPDCYRLAIRTENFKYMYDSQIPDQPGLYDLKLDPKESINLWRTKREEALRFEELRRKHQARVDQTSHGIQVQDVSVNDQLRNRLKALGYL
jgi:arylsulfatase A-like enzyme